MDGHERHDRLLGAFLAGALDPAAARRWDEHLLECEQCWRTVQEDRDGRRAAELLRQPAPPVLADRVAFAVEVAAAGRATASTPGDPLAAADSLIRLRDCLGWIMRTNRPAPHTLTGAYALDALTRADRARFERHLTRCEQCAREVRALAEATAALAAAVAAEPPAELMQRVLTAAARTRQLPSSRATRHCRGRADTRQ